MFVAVGAALIAAPQVQATRFSPPLNGLQVKNANALFALERYQRVPVYGVTDEPIQTTFCRCGPSAASSAKKSSAKKVLFLHGADSNALEWRHIMADLSDVRDCVALDWWSGGFTERGPITDVLVKQPTPPTPWLSIRSHILAFWESVLDSEPVVLVGTSLGGAVALDFAASHPEAVSELVLIDAGGQSYKSPDADTVTALAPIVLKVKQIAAWVQARVPDEGVRLVALHREEPGWLEAGGEYLRSGSYQRAVGPALIRTVPQKTLVVWGEDDDILPVQDAAAFERDLPDCDAVKIIPKSGHSPHLDNPSAVSLHLREFLARVVDA
jgi:pimeloyl-ACP methyl ester carboxylesterase